MAKSTAFVRIYNETRHLITAHYYLLPPQNNLTGPNHTWAREEFVGGGRGSMYSNKLERSKMREKGAKNASKNRVISP